MEIQVTQEHIDQGIQIEPGLCPLALAIRDALPHGWWVNVGPNNVYVYDKRHDPDNQRGQCIDLPEDARAFIKEFDSLSPNRHVEPFSFEFEVEV